MNIMTLLCHLAEWFMERNITSSPLSFFSLSTAEQQNDLLFEVQPGSDATALWKVAVRVVCTKVRPKSLPHMPTEASAHTFMTERDRCE